MIRISAAPCVVLLAFTIGWRTLTAQQTDSARRAERAARFDSTRRAERVARRLVLLDSLAKGRQLWKRAGIDAYVLQSHAACFCIYVDSPPPGLLTIRNGVVVARRPSIRREYAESLWTVDTLFDRDERDLRGGTEQAVANIMAMPSIAEEFVRKAVRLDLHPKYGFPLRYQAETPEIPDIWIDIQVDTFAVLPPTKPPRRRSQ
jgi:hypothetical protein